MDEECPVTEPDSKLQPVDPVRNLDVTVGDDEQPERLLEMLDQWEEGFFLAGEPSPESLGIDDPLLRAAFLERIEERKRLYESVGLTTKSDSLGAVGREKAQVSAEIGELLNGAQLDRGDKPVIFKSVGIAVEDIAAAKLVYEKLAERTVQ